MAGGSAFGQFMVQPMRINVESYPNKRTVTTFAVENQNETTPSKVDLRVLDMTQDSSGMWQTIEPDARVVPDPNGARWVNVGSEDQPVRVDISRLRGCAGWLRLEQDVVELSALDRKVLNLWIQVPTGVQGHYCAAIIAQTQLTEDNDTGTRAPVLLQFLIPVIINVQGRPMRDKIELIDANLTFREAESINPAATLVTLGVNNDGPTYARLVGVSRIYGQTGGHWRKVTELHHPDIGILPGVKINLKQDLGRLLPSGKYRIEGALYVNGRRAHTIGKEIEFTGDDRPGGRLALDATLDLDPKEVSIDVRPGTLRTTLLKVSNTSEDPVTVDAALLLPDHMTVRSWKDEEGREIRGEDFGCVEWVTIEPTQFTLPGYGRKNVKVVSRMPAEASLLPNHYATIKLHGTYADGQTGGTSQGLIYLNTIGMEGSPRVEGTQMTFSEAGPLRYIVTATFSNLGNTHVRPRCRVLLTEATPGITGMMLRNVEMSSAVYDQGGNMLPLEIRNFTGVLDVASVPEGVYYVTVALEYGGGASAQRQAAIRISDGGGNRSVEIITLDAVGGPTRIQLQ